MKMTFVPPTHHHHHKLNVSNISAVAGPILTRLKRQVPRTILSKFFTKKHFARNNSCRKKKLSPKKFFCQKRNSAEKRISPQKDFCRKRKFRRKKKNSPKNKFRRKKYSSKKIEKCAKFRLLANSRQRCQRRLLEIDAVLFYTKENQKNYEREFL